MYLDVANSAKLPSCWSSYAEFSLTIVNQINNEYSVRKDMQHKFNEQESDWGFTSFIPLGTLNDPHRGYLVNDTLVVEVTCKVDEKDTAERSRKRLKKKHRGKKHKSKEEAESHLYTIIKVARDEDLAEQIRKDIYFDLIDYDKVKSFRVQKKTPFNVFKEEVAEEFGIPVQFQRFWVLAKRHNDTRRPFRPLTHSEEAGPGKLNDGSSSFSEEVLANLYCMAVVRLVNGAVEKTQKKELVPIAMAAEELNDNNLSGYIPPELGKLTDLFDLNVANNNLEGPIPDNISSCKNLNTCSISWRV